MKEFSRFEEFEKYVNEGWEEFNGLITIGKIITASLYELLMFDQAIRVVELRMLSDQLRISNKIIDGDWEDGMKLIK